MILDDLANASLYAALSPDLRRAFEFLEQTSARALVVGRHAIDGDRVVAAVDDYETKPESKCRWEAHRRHVDVQSVAIGRERIGVTPIQAIDAEPYDAKRDVLFGRGTGDFVTLAPGRFVILFPHDAHMPGVSAGTPSRVRKIVVKIRIDPGATWALPSPSAVP